MFRQMNKSEFILNLVSNVIWVSWGIELLLWITKCRVSTKVTESDIQQNDRFIVKNILIHFINDHIYSCSIETKVLILPSKLLKELEYSKEKKSHFCYSEGKIRLLTENEFTHQKTPKYFNN